MSGDEAPAEPEVSLEMEVKTEKPDDSAEEAVKEETPTEEAEGDAEEKAEQPAEATEEPPAEEAAAEPEAAETAEEDDDMTEAPAEPEAAPEESTPAEMETEEPQPEERETSEPPAAEEKVEETEGEKRAAEVADDTEGQEAAKAQETEAEESSAVEAPEGPNFIEADFAQLAVEKEGVQARINGSNYFHILQEKFIARVKSQSAGLGANYTCFFAKVDNVGAAVDELYGSAWNKEVNASLLHQGQGFAYVVKPEFPSFRNISQEELAAVVAKGNVEINGSNYFHCLEGKFRDSMDKKYGAESKAFIVWFNQADNAADSVDALYGSSWNKDVNASVLHSNQGFAYAIERVSEE